MTTLAVSENNAVKYLPGTDTKQKHKITNQNQADAKDRKIKLQFL